MALMQIVSAQTDPKAAAEQYLEAFGIDPPANATVSHLSPEWMYSGGAYAVVLDKDLALRVVNNIDLEQAISANKGFNKEVPYIGDQAVIVKAQGFLSHLQTSPDLTEVTVEMDRSILHQGHLTQRSMVQVRFESK